MNRSKNAEIAVAGHACLDIIPEIKTDVSAGLIEPGKLLEIGPAQISAGGAVSNVGIALYKLGVQVRLLGKVGDDIFGRAILERFNEIDRALTENIVSGFGEFSSYTIVINLPGSDRSFWHYPGCNDTFSAKDINYHDLIGIKLFHFGYPPLMRQMIKNDGEELLNLLQKVKAAGVVTSLDMAYPDPNSYSGRVDWRKVLKRVLPFVDIFLPGLDEILYMLGYKNDKEFSRSTLYKISEELIEFGAGVVGLKLGARGLYLRTSQDCSRFNNIIEDVSKWSDREIYSPCYKVDVKGTTGSGDATVAGFLAAFVNGYNPGMSINTAVAVGACSVEAADATSGIINWNILQDRMQSGWKKHSIDNRFAGFHRDECEQLAYGPADLKRVLN